MRSRSEWVGRRAGHNLRKTAGDKDKDLISPKVEPKEIKQNEKDNDNKKYHQKLRLQVMETSGNLVIKLIFRKKLS